MKHAAPLAADLIGRIIRLEAGPPSRADGKIVSGALLRCHPCAVASKGKEAGQGMFAVVVSGTSDHPARTKCADCGRHMGWFALSDFPKLQERVIA